MVVLLLSTEHTGIRYGWQRYILGVELWIHSKSGHSRYVGTGACLDGTSCRFVIVYHMVMGWDWWTPQRSVLPSGRGHRSVSCFISLLVDGGCRLPFAAYWLFISTRSAWALCFPWAVRRPLFSYQLRLKTGIRKATAARQFSTCSHYLLSVLRCAVDGSRFVNIKFFFVIGWTAFVRHITPACSVQWMIVGSSGSCTVCILVRAGCALPHFLFLSRLVVYPPVGSDISSLRISISDSSPLLPSARYWCHFILWFAGFVFWF